MAEQSNHSNYLDNTVHHIKIMKNYKKILTIKPHTNNIKCGVKNEKNIL